MACFSDHRGPELILEEFRPAAQGMMAKSKFTLCYFPSHEIEVPC
jgi:hypothetical protein